MFATVEETIQDLQNGKLIILVDDENRENEGDLVVLAEHATPEAINFMITHGKGLVCTAIEQTLAKHIGLPLMTEHNTDPLGTAFTISIDHINTTTGISAIERSLTIQALTNPDISGSDFKKPGHVFPLIARPGGVTTRPGHTEASVDLAKLADGFPAGVICEIIKEDGTMARLPDLIKMAKTYHLKLLSIEQLIAFQTKENQKIGNI